MVQLIVHVRKSIRVYKYELNQIKNGFSGPEIDQNAFDRKEKL